eukprot:13000988-Alexandrium_andersonii.AAC.1
MGVPLRCFCGRQCCGWREGWAGAVAWRAAPSRGGLGLAGARGEVGAGEVWPGDCRSRGEAAVRICGTAVGSGGAFR